MARRLPITRDAVSLKQTLYRAARGLGGLAAARNSQWRGERLLILCYHGVSLDDEHCWNPSLYVSPETFRGRDLPAGTQVVVSPWHLHRHERIWPHPDGFDPGRWGTEAGRACARDAYIPFSRGARVCPGAGFAMVEGPLDATTLMAAVDEAFGVPWEL